MSCLLTGILLTSSLYSIDNVPKTRLAAQYMAQATYVQCGIKEQIEPELDRLQKKYIPDYLQKIGVSGTFIYRLVKDQKIEYTWSF
jgi:hypothetical protein